MAKRVVKGNTKTVRLPVNMSGIKQAYLKNVDDKDRFPLEGYAALIAIYTTLYFSFYALARRKGSIPERIPLGDLALLGIATHKFSRHITKDLVTSVLRSPFTEFAESTGASELYEKSRGKGFSYAFADLITCQWCLGGWTAMFAGFGLALAPKFTRMAAGIFTIEAAADFLHLSYDIMKNLKTRTALNKPAGKNKQKTHGQ